LGLDEEKEVMAIAFLHELWSNVYQEWFERGAKFY